MAQQEHKLQAQIFTWHWNNKPTERGRLFATFQEVKSPIEGGLKKSLGLVRGVPDLVLVRDGGFLVGIELKTPNSTHLVSHLIEQCSWLINVPYIGYFCDTFKMAEEVLNGGKGIDPKKVLDYCKSVTTKNILWDNTLFITK
ncbi:MAG: hypothetical protein RR513_06470 [Muribaculaceae bacterium]